MRFFFLLFLDGLRFILPVNSTRKCDEKKISV